MSFDFIAHADKVAVRLREQGYIVTRDGSRSVVDSPRGKRLVFTYDEKGWEMRHEGELSAYGPWYRASEGL